MTMLKGILCFVKSIIICCTRKHLKGAVKDAKERWMQKTCEEIEKGSPFRSWDAVKHIKSGFCGHQSIP